MKIRFLAMLALVLLVGCGSDGGDSEQTATSDEETTAQREPDYITVQHILIGFRGSVPGKPITRTKDEARELAAEILRKAKSGEDFDALVKEYTDDSHPGIYKMANFGIAANRSERVFARDGMVPAFGNVGFPLAVGGIGLAEFDPATSRYGWHIIKRVE